jgi:hypothetical protein
MHDVFISYASKDETTADAACAALESAGLRCWIAHRDVPAGAILQSAIVHAIGDSRVMVLVFSSNSNNSGDVFREVQCAVQKEVVIVPFRIEAVALAEKLSYYLGSIHWLDALTPPLEAHLGTLCERVKMIVDGGPETVAATGTKRSAPPIITVKWPNRWTFWPIGFRETVKWEFFAEEGTEIDRFTVELFSRDAKVLTAGETRIREGSRSSLDWAPPDELPLDRRYRLRVTAWDTFGRGTSADSKTFRIQKDLDPDAVMVLIGSIFGGLLGLGLGYRTIYPILSSPAFFGSILPAKGEEFSLAAAVAALLTAILAAAIAGFAAKVMTVCRPALFLVLLVTISAGVVGRFLPILFDFHVSPDQGQALGVSLAIFFAPWNIGKLFAGESCPARAIDSAVATLNRRFNRGKKK